MPATLDMSKLSVAEKLQLVAELWDSLDNDAAIELSETQLAEIERRLREADENPDCLVSDAEMRRRLGWTK